MAKTMNTLAMNPGKTRIGRRVALVLAAIVGALVLSSGAALALGENRTHYVNCGSFSQDPLTPECYGTLQDDDIQGRNAADIVYAKGGNDFVMAYSGNDVVYGGTGADTAAGVDGDDQLYGGGGADFLTDAAGGDTDELGGGRGNDSLSAYDHDHNDTLVCGPGSEDHVYFDKDPTSGAKDKVSDTCEHKHPNHSDGF